MDESILQELIDKGYCSIKYSKLELVLLTIPFAQKVGFKVVSR